MLVEAPPLRELVAPAPSQIVQQLAAPQLLSRKRICLFMHRQAMHPAVGRLRPEADVLHGCVGFGDDVHRVRVLSEGLDESCRSPESL